MYPNVLIVLQLTHSDTYINILYLGYAMLRGVVYFGKFFMCRVV